MSAPVVYLDHNATTRPGPAAVEAVRRGLEVYWHNPSSIHRPGQDARHAIELARGQIAALLGAKSREVTFTGSGTEAIDLAIRGVLGAMSRANPEKNIIITTPIEHSAVLNLCRQLQDTGRASVVTLPVSGGGIVDLAALESLLIEHAGRVALLSMQWVNNETGVIQPVHAAGALCVAHHVVFHCDATQWVGKMPLDLGSPGAPKVDLLSASPHKFHGPKGVGVLWARRGVRLLPPTPGAQELGRRGGTEPVPAILGAGAAAREAKAWVEDESNRAGVAVLRDELEGGVLACCPGSVVNAPGDPALRIWNTTNIAFPRLEAEAILLSLSERGVCVSAGAACASGSLDPSPVLLAMGLDEQLAHGSIRMSLGRQTTRHEIGLAVEAIAGVVAQLSRSLPG